MARKTIDCRSIPSETGCTVTISGEEHEVLELAAAHSVAVHGHTDGEDLRRGLREAMRDEHALELEDGAFLQFIEFHTRDLGGVRNVTENWRERMGAETSARWGIVAADRDRADTYVEVVAFPDHASAMRNSQHPVTTDFAEQMHEVTEGEPDFRNLDVAMVMRM